jgi:hypothetical protein
MIDSIVNVFVRLSEQLVFMIDYLLALSELLCLKLKMLLIVFQTFLVGLLSLFKVSADVV